MTQITAFPHFLELTQELLPAQRGLGNYAMAPITALLYTVDVALSVGVTTSTWVVINIPIILSLLLV